MSVAPLRIVSAGTERVDEVEPLWLAMHEVHVGAGPQAAEVRPFRAPAETWRRRRQVYERLLSDEGDGHLLLAEQDGVICGYAVLAFSPARRPSPPATASRSSNRSASCRTSVAEESAAR